MDNLEAIIEGLLFASGEAVPLFTLCEITEQDTAAVRRAIAALSQKYEQGNHGIRLYQTEDTFQIGTLKEHDDYIRKLVKPRRYQPLNIPTLEVLAIIAYKQPITRSLIESIKGVNCDYSVTRLLDLELIEECGKLDAPGRPILYATTTKFLQCFNINGLHELPPIEDFAELAISS